MKTINLLGKKYELIKNDKDCFNLSEVEDKVTEYFDEYDYIFGDYAYDKVRLKGYYESDNENANSVNDISGLEDYILNYCSYGARTFLLKKIK